MKRRMVTMETRIATRRTMKMEAATSTPKLQPDPIVPHLDLVVEAVVFEVDSILVAAVVVEVQADQCNVVEAEDTDMGMFIFEIFLNLIIIIINLN